MKISLIIAFYKNLPALKLILCALARQSFRDFEVIVAEDDNDPATPVFLQENAPSLPFAIQHVCQKEDLGFRKNQILNAALRAAEGDFVVFLDGDCVPHAHFLSAYAEVSGKRMAAFFGRRVMLSPTLTTQVLATQDLRRLSFWGLLGTGSERLKYGLYLPFLLKNARKTGIWGCNWGARKEHLMAVNGFDEDYQTAGVGEDVDIEWRLRALGLRLRSLRFSAIVYHLYHKPNYDTAAVNSGFALLRDKQSAGQFFCQNGLASSATAG